MKVDYNEFLIDVLNIVPNEVEFFIQAPSLDNLTILNMIMDDKYDYYKLIKLDKQKKKELIKEEIENSVSPYIQNVQIKKEENLLFEGFDGFEFGTISKSIIVPKWFEKKYIPDICVISDEW